MTRRRTWLGLALFAVLALAGVGGWWWWYSAPPPPPTVDLAGVDPAIAELIESTRREVIARPRSSASWGKLGMVLQAHGKPSEASFCYEQAERLDPKEPRWPYYRGLILMRSDPSQAASCLRRAVARWQKDSVDSHFRLARLLLEQGQLDEAEELLARAKQMKRTHPHGYLLRARLALARQRWKDVLSEVQGCWLDEHARQQARMLSAEAWQNLKEPARAEDLLAEAKRMPPDWPWRDPLAEELERLVVGVRARRSLAEDMRQQGRLDKAAEVLEQLTRDYPQDMTHFVMLGDALAKMQRFPEAEKALKRAVEGDPRCVEGWFKIGIVRRILGKRDDAIDAFRHAIRYKPDHTRAHFSLGRALQEAGDRQEARKELNETLRSQPDFEPARKALVELDGKKP